MDMEREHQLQIQILLTLTAVDMLLQSLLMNLQDLFSGHGFGCIEAIPEADRKLLSLFTKLKSYTSTKLFKMDWASGSDRKHRNKTNSHSKPTAEDFK